MKDFWYGVVVGTTVGFSLWGYVLWLMGVAKI